MYRVTSRDLTKNEFVEMLAWIIDNIGNIVVPDADGWDVRKIHEYYERVPYILNGISLYVDLERQEEAALFKMMWT